MIDRRLITGAIMSQKTSGRKASGKARFVKKDNVGMLKVPFFGPFYFS